LKEIDAEEIAENAREQKRRAFIAAEVQAIQAELAAKKAAEEEERKAAILPEHASMSAEEWTANMPVHHLKGIEAMQHQQEVHLRHKKHHAKKHHHKH